MNFNWTLLAVLLGLLLVATTIHETTHWLVLKSDGCQVKLVIRHFGGHVWLPYGVGWRYNPSQISLTTRRWSFLLGPLSELAFWLIIASLLGGYIGLCCLVIGLASHCSQLFVTHGDGAQLSKLPKG